MDNIMQPTDNPSAEAFKRELYRRSLDSIRVYNPTDQDYFVEWDGHNHRVPNKNKDTGEGNGMRILPRYIAEKYCREMKNKLINELNDQRLEDIKDKLTKSGATDIVYNANLQMERQHDLRTDNSELINKYYEILWLGVEEEFGMDTPEMPKDKPLPNNTPPEEQVLNKLKNKRYIAPSSQEPAVLEASGEVAEAVKVPQKAFKDMTDEEKKAWRIENLRKAREARKAVK